MLDLMMWWIASTPEYRVWCGEQLYLPQQLVVRRLSNKKVGLEKV